jgi:hypothetical protein
MGFSGLHYVKVLSGKEERGKRKEERGKRKGIGLREPQPSYREYFESLNVVFGDLVIWDLD